MDIKPAGIADIPELLALIQSAYRGESSKRGWTNEADLMSGARTTFDILKSEIEAEGSEILRYASEEDDIIIGCVKVEISQHRGEKKCNVELLTVSPGFQNRGVGKKLLNAAHDWARRKNCVALIMKVVSIRDTLIAWYKRHGFQETGESEPFPSKPIYGIPKKELEFHVLEKRL